MSNFLTQKFNKFSDTILVQRQYDQDPAVMLPYLIQTDGTDVQTDADIKIGVTIGDIQTLRANLDGLKKLDAMSNVKSISFSR